jgi:hypothetical protein
MSGQPYVYASDPEKYRAEYMRNLQERIDLDDQVLQAVKGYVSNGTLPGISQMPDNRTTAEKLLDVEKLKQMLVNDLRPVMETKTAQAFVQGLIQSPLNIDNKLVIFMTQRAPEIVSQLSKLYRVGIKGDQNDIATFVDFVNNMYNDKNKATTSVKGVLDRGIGSTGGVVGKEDLDSIRTMLLNMSAEIDRYAQTIIGGPPQNQFNDLILSVIERMSYISDHLPTSQQLKQYYIDMNSQTPGAVFNPQDAQMVFDIMNFISEEMPNKNTLNTLITDMNKQVQQFFNFTIRKEAKEVNMYQPKQPNQKSPLEIGNFINRTLLQYAINIDSIIPDMNSIQRALGGTHFPQPQPLPQQYDNGEDEEQSDLGGPPQQGERGIVKIQQPTRMSGRQYGMPDEEGRYGIPEDEGSTLDLRSQSSLGGTQPSLGDYPEEGSEIDPFATQPIRRPITIPQARRGPESVSTLSTDSYAPRSQGSTPSSDASEPLSSISYLRGPGLKSVSSSDSSSRSSGPLSTISSLDLGARKQQKPDKLTLVKGGDDETATNNRIRAYVNQIIDGIGTMDPEDMGGWSEVQIQGSLRAIRDYENSTGLHFFLGRDIKDVLRELGLNDRITGHGLKKRRGRPKGSGFKQNIEQHIDTQKGIQPDFRFSKFGKYLIRNDHLLDNTVSIRNGKGLNIAGLPSTKSNPKVITIIKKIIGGTLPTFDEMNRLTEDEKAYLHNISKKSNILEKLNIPTPSKDKEEKDLHEFEVLKGEIMAGNDNKDMVRKFKGLILKFSKAGTLPKQQVNEILQDLLDLGF